MTDLTPNQQDELQTPATSAHSKLLGETIGKALRSQFEAVLAEPVPAELLDLLDALERQEAKA